MSLPIDETSRARLATDGLTFAILDVDDRAAFATWHQSVSRGFLSPVSTEEQIDQARTYIRGDRLVGVWDPGSTNPAFPVATSEAWISDLTVPGRAAVPAWAISAVTVAQTHRRRGIARALMEAELRTAAALDVPVAMLTVSESTIYGRFGFAPSALARDLTIDTRRARWIGPTAPGRVHYVSADQLHDDGHAIVERVRLEAPGQIAYSRSGVLWERQLGLGAGDDSAKKLRFVRYDDAHGVPQGFAVYTVSENESDFAQSEATLNALVSATPEAYAALWRFVLELDLVSKVQAHLRPVDEPLRWMIDDFRAIHVDERDHLWTRILDVKGALEARTYGTPGRLVIGVQDDLGFAEGAWALEIDRSGAAGVTAVDEPADVTMLVNALSAAPRRRVRASPGRGWFGAGRRHPHRRDVPLPRGAVPKHLVLTRSDLSPGNPSDGQISSAETACASGPSTDKITYTETFSTQELAMSQVNQSTANWRLFGGGGLAVGGLLYAIAVLLSKDGDRDLFWLGVIAIAVVGVGFFFVAYGETGSNGAVGDSSTGKLALFVTAGLFLLYALLLVLLHQGSDIDSSIFRVIQLATVVALAWSALEISRKGVAKGLAAVALFAVAAWAAIVQILDWVDEYGWWRAFILGLALLATGVLYVLND